MTRDEEEDERAGHRHASGEVEYDLIDDDDQDVIELVVVLDDPWFVDDDEEIEEPDDNVYWPESRATRVIPQRRYPGDTRSNS